MIKEIESQEEFDSVMKSDDADNVEWCPHCGKAYLIDWTEEEIDKMIIWSSNRFSPKAILIQDALPNRNIYEREIMRYAWNGDSMLKCSEECNG